MRVFQINTFGNKSTGKIAVDIYKTLKQYGHESMIAFARNAIEDGVPHIVIGNKLDVYAHGVLTRLTDKAGFYSKRATKKLIKQIEEYNPDIIHLHNIHGYYINIELLFKYLSKCGKPVVWTLHDCWAMTGHCCYFDFCGCDRWKTQCHDCVQLDTYPKAMRDNSFNNYLKKKELFTSVPNLTLVPVSSWLDGIIGQSYLKDCAHVVIHNGVDLDKFKPFEGDIRAKYNLGNKRIVLGVASEWSRRKGFDDFLRLAELLDDEYCIVLVGLEDEHIKRLKPNMTGIRRTESVSELAKLYSAAQLLLNPTYEDNYPTVNIEAIACGTPVVTYRTGGSPEGVLDGCGAVVEKGDIEAAARIIKEGGLKIPDEYTRLKADKSSCFSAYVYLYERLLRRRG